MSKLAPDKSLTLPENIDLNEGYLNVDGWHIDLDTSEPCRRCHGSGHEPSSWWRRLKESLRGYGQLDPEAELEREGLRRPTK